MTSRRRQALRERLLALRAEVTAAAPVKIEPSRQDPTAVGVPDEDAQALAEMTQTLASQRNKKQAVLAAQIDRALRRMETDPTEVGLCAECGEEIPEKRLAIVPYALLCADCQAKQDPRRGTTRRGLTDFK